MKKFELRKIIREELKDKMLNEYSKKIQGTFVVITGLNKPGVEFIVNEVVKIIKDKTEIGDVKLKSVRLEY